MTASANTTHHGVAIIGSGFSGLGMAIHLKRAGDDDFIVFEKDHGVGGTWRANSYPGCACDVQSHLYSYSFEPNPHWTRMFATQPELQRYLEHCARKYALMPHLRLGCAVRELRWNEAAQRWHITDTAGQHHTASIVVCGIGALSVPAIPDIAGLADFRGTVFHSQQWNHDYDLRGKRIAVIGTGASAIQFVPQIQPQVGRLDLYQRTAPWILPKPDRRIAPLERTLFERFPLLQKIRRGLLYAQLESRVFGFTTTPALMQLPQTMARRHLHSQVSDPQLRRALTPDYRLGCKRVLLSNDYYPALTRQNVSVITAGIASITANAITDRSGVQREADAIILATGFKASDFIAPGMLAGRDGLDLAQAWADGPSAYKGICVSGFPNLFLLMGPNTGLGHGSMIYMIESQIRYVMNALAHMRRNRWQSIDVKPAVQEHYNRDLQHALERSVWNSGGCNSWYLHAATGRNTTLWPGFTFRYRACTRRFDVDTYQINQRAPQR
jgi:cation diffusion facilitator CzcD-associated flavoprotein CzcO